MAQLPIVMGPQGPIPTTPATLRQMLVNLVASTNPDYTANLPGSLIEDICSTDVGGLVISNQFMIDLINSISPYAANAFILNQLGTDVYGIQLGQPTNTSVDLIFSGTPGYIIIQGFTVSDGNYQYICADGGVIGTEGVSLPIHAVAAITGTWPVPAGTVTNLVTSVPGVINLSVINPTNGIPSTKMEDMTSFRTRTLAAGLAASTGMDRYLKTLLWNIPGVIQRLVSVRQDINTNQYCILVGGGDPYQVAWAIYYALFNLVTLDRPQITIDDMTRTNPIIVTTSYNHNLLTGMLETISGVVGMNGINGKKYYIDVINKNEFALFTQQFNDDGTITLIPVDGTILLPYKEGGIVTPNPILQQISLLSYPDTYLVPFILPAQELVTMVVNWDTDSINYVSETAIAQAAAPALIDYINSIYVGTSPINIYVMIDIFTTAVQNILQAENITVLNFNVSFSGVGQIPESGSGVIYGDPFSYFYTDSSNVLVTRI